MLYLWDVTAACRTIGKVLKSFNRCNGFQVLNLERMYSIFNMKVYTFLDTGKMKNYGKRTSGGKSSNSCHRNAIKVHTVASKFSLQSFIHFHYLCWEKQGVNQKCHVKCFD